MQTLYRKRNDFLNQLPYSVAWQDLKDRFRDAGHITFADVASERGSRRSKGFGFVTYETTREADKAVGIFYLI